MGWKRKWPENKGRQERKNRKRIIPKPATGAAANIVQEQRILMQQKRNIKIAEIADLLKQGKITSESISQKVLILNRETLKHLTPLEKKVIKMRFGVGYKKRITVELVANSLKKIHKELTLEQVKQIETDAIEKIRNAMGVKKS